jgi:hypothetical protein
MAQTNSISFDEVLALLRGPVVQEFEIQYVASRGYRLHESWGDSQALTKQLAFAKVTRDCIEQTLVSRADLVGRFWDALLSLLDDGEEWPEGEEPDPDDEPDTVESDGPTMLMRGFSIVAACSIWLLAERTESELVSWLKFRRIPHHKKHAKDLREMFTREARDP